MSGLLDRLASRGLDGNTHAPLVSLADRLTGSHFDHQALRAFLDPFHAVVSIANFKRRRVDQIDAAVRR